VSGRTRCYPAQEGRYALAKISLTSSEARNCQGKFLWLGRFRNVFLITRVERTLPVAIPGISGEGDSRCQSTLVEGTISDLADQAIAVFTRHSDVGDDDVRFGVILEKRPDEIKKAKRLDGRGFQLFLSCRFRSESQGAYEA